MVKAGVTACTFNRKPYLSFDDDMQAIGIRNGYFQ